MERHRVADFHIGSIFDVGDEIADFARAENIDRFFVRSKYADFVDLESFSVSP